MKKENNKQRVAFVTSFPIDPQHPNGGVESVSVNLLEALSKFNNLEIHIITLNREIQESRLDNWLGMTIHRLPRSNASELMNVIGPGKKTISAYVNSLGPDVIHAHDTYGFMVESLSQPKVFTVHGFIHADTLLAGRKFAFFRSLIWKHIEERNWSRQSNIISISPYVRERVSRSSNAMIFDIENPISPKYFLPDQSEEPGTIFTSAVITPRKNLLNLVKAVKELLDQGHEIELRVAGGEPDAVYAKRVKQFVHDNNIESAVSFLGRISSDQVVDELRKASIYALVSLEENAPMGVEEAMAAGLPVLTSNRCGMPYMVRNLECGLLVDPTSVYSIKNKLELMLTNFELRLTMGNVAHDFAKRYFHADRVAERTRNVYQEIGS